MQFLSWRRSSVYDLVPSPDLVDGRLVGRLPLTLTDDATGETAAGGVDFHLMAPHDIGGLVHGAVLRTVPGDLARDVEATKLVHVDFVEPDLPWRYTPRLAAGDQLAPGWPCWSAPPTRCTSTGRCCGLTAPACSTSTGPPMPIAGRTCTTTASDPNRCPG
ncbi:hypothetical protein H4K38_11035 [Streptomyces sp. I3(2020)]|nr:hypothetical protein [Streptomyces sp. I3(2020)]